MLLKLLILPSLVWWRRLREERWIWWLQWSQSRAWTKACMQGVIWECDPREQKGRQDQTNERGNEGRAIKDVQSNWLSHVMTIPSRHLQRDLTKCVLEHSLWGTIAKDIYWPLLPLWARTVCTLGWCMSEYRCPKLIIRFCAEVTSLQDWCWQQCLEWKGGQWSSAKRSSMWSWREDFHPHQQRVTLRPKPHLSSLLCISPLLLPATKSCAKYIIQYLYLSITV